MPPPLAAGSRLQTATRHARGRTAAEFLLVAWGLQAVTLGADSGRGLQPEMDASPGRLSHAASAADSASQNKTRSQRQQPCAG